MEIQDHETSTLEAPDCFLPYSQAGWIINFKKINSKLEDKAIPTNYLRCLTKDIYPVYRKDKKGMFSVRKCEFVCKHNSQEKKLT